MRMMDPHSRDRHRMDLACRERLHIDHRISCGTSIIEKDSVLQKITLKKRGVEL